MTKTSSLLLPKLVENPVVPREGKVDFIAAASMLDLTSVFDIADMPKAEFIKKLAMLNEDNGAVIHNAALAYASQLQWLYDQQLPAPTQTPARKKRGMELAYSTQFDDDWSSICAPGAIAAIDSPVAYLRALYLFATQLEQTGAGPGTKNLLSKRRPDLKTLKIDHASTFAQRPLLSLVDEMLRKQIELHHIDEELNALLTKQHYPLMLPYHHHHHQCRLGLSGTQHTLGELNYRISLQLPFDEASSAQYGTTNGHAQCLLSELSPEQQTLLTQSPITDAKLLATYLGGKSAPEKLDDFLKCTALDSTQLQALLSQNSFAPYTSRSVTEQTLATYGARYINGPTSDSSTRIEVGTGPASDPPKIEAGTSADEPTAKLLNTSPDRFDRLHRMIRLQKWLDLPFTDLDTLIVSAMACEGRVNLQITRNTLRALGVYRYFSRRYRVKPLEFSAWLDLLPVQASANEQPLFDQVFNRTALSKQLLPLDGLVFDSQTRQQLCAALGLSDTPDSLQLLIEALPVSATRSLATYSAIYRQARIAQVFGLSVLHCKQLADLLGPSTWSTLITPALRAGSGASVDFLDVLMQLDWAVTWLKDSNTSVTQLRQQLLLEPVTDNPALQRWNDLLALGAQASIKQFLGSAVPPLDSTELMSYYERHFISPQTAPTPKQLILLAPDITTLLRLPVTSTSLRQLLLNPHWLDSDKPPRSLVELSLGTLYLLQRFKDCCDTYGMAQESLLAFFQSANSNMPQNINARLSQWLGWDEKELQVLTDSLAPKKLTSMNQLDWIMRCRQACTITRLSSQTLLDASKLDTASNFSQWKSVGEAIIAARQ